MTTTRWFIVALAAMTWGPAIIAALVGWAFRLGKPQDDPDKPGYAEPQTDNHRRRP
jgi:hypothetical protein